MTAQRSLRKVSRALLLNKLAPMDTIQSPKWGKNSLLTPPMSELKTALQQSARLQRRLAVAYGIRLEKLSSR